MSGRVAATDGPSSDATVAREACGLESVENGREWIASKVPEGCGQRALDLGGRHGEIEDPIRRRGYRYFNVDIHPQAPLRGDATRLPFRSESFGLVLSIDTLEHFLEPGRALEEIHRVLQPGGTVLICVPFLHPFHGDDYWRYTPLGLRVLLDRAGLQILELKAVDGVLTLVGLMAGTLLQRVGLGRLAPKAVRVGKALDARTVRFQGGGLASAHSFLVTATRPAPQSRSRP